MPYYKKGSVPEIPSWVDPNRLYSGSMISWETNPRKNELLTGWYNKKLERINPDEREMGAMLYKTKSFDSLFDFLKKFDYKKLKKKLQYAKNDLIIYVHNGWNNIEIEVFAKDDFEKRHADYLKA